MSPDAQYLRLERGPLELRIQLDEHHLWFPPHVDGIGALLSAGTLFWRTIEQLAPGFEVRENP